MRPIALAEARCSRCDKAIYIATRSVLGLDRLKAKWGIICEDCIEPEERHRMMIEQGEALQEKGAAR